MTDLPVNNTILSGIQPSGTLHIGNYLGALKQWVALQTDNTAYYCIVDEHAITVPYEPKDLPERVLNAAAIYLAVGVDPDKSTIFVQSHIPAHTELAWLLGTITSSGELSRMTQFKDKARRLGGQNSSKISLGLFAYPVLMAADILLYQTTLVPVGEDQTQHIELARNLAERFNKRFGQAFALPEAFVEKNVARIMSLTDPMRKMGKSDGEKTYVALTDDPNIIRKKIMSATTKTDPVFSFEQAGGASPKPEAQAGPAVKNLLNIYRAFSEEEPAAIEQKFAGSGYKEFKEALVDLLTQKLTPIRERYTELRSNEPALKKILETGASKAASVATKTLHSVKEKMGLA